jgi:metal-responsive CopG/Arc/MetJ family transcriptional regulator
MNKVPRITVSFSLPDSDKWILEGVDRLARMKYGRRGRSKMIVLALQMYLKKQSDGNPQRIFQSNHHTLTDVEREKAGIRFLKAKCRLSLRKISAVTEWSYSGVQRLCLDILVKSVRYRGSFPMNRYRQKWNLFMSGVPADEAFTAR